MNGEGPAFRLQSRLDAEAAHAAFAGNGRVQLPGALESQDAARLHESLQREVPWQLHFNDGPRTHDIDLAQYEALDEARREALARALYANAARGFQYLFCNFPVTDACEQGRDADLLVMQFQAFVNSDEFLGFARQVTGHHDICLADAQATRYEPGHFLTAHDDRAAGKHRVAAYVLSLSPGWRPDFGGLLNFVDADGNVSEAYTPGFNVLSLFQVPQAHAVSCVAPFAPAPRYSLSGWLRTA